ncbi:MAG: biphenyl 2,3-dioxygenase [Chloroflexi bacterium RBG_16_47_49]|nr:MAG: biphenyl 2,3-dioxygenase [Chloroflexi bacterium RBG_16_47_49]
MDNYSKLAQGKLEYIPVGSVEELKDGERIFIEIDETPIVILFVNGQYFAIADVCSHDDGPVGEGNIEGYEIICPRHGARFDIRNGKVLALPAFVDIPAYPVRVVGDQIEIGLPVED